LADLRRLDDQFGGRELHQLAVAELSWLVNLADQAVCRVGAWLRAMAVIPPMRAAGYGRIVNLSSTLRSLHHMTRPTAPAYRVSKRRSTR
jgi:NAD(P)-dependent dehydrogenase (short-subunit alcohol dehydrogenase family)